MGTFGRRPGGRRVGDPAAAPAGDPVRLLAAALARLDGRVRRWSPARWRTRAADGRLRGDVAYDLVVMLADLGRGAGTGAPPGAVPPRLGDHALADQVAVVGGDLLAAPDVAAVAGEALARVLAADRLL